MADTQRYHELIDPDFMTRLDRLEIVSRRIFAGQMKGERRSRRKGQSVEFADYRNYAVGDDLRFLDWNIYGRLDRLFVKLFFEEEDLHVNLLIDNSASMAFGEPAKAHFIRRLAAAIGYIGLINYDRLSISAFSETFGPQRVGMRGRSAVPELLDYLLKLEPQGTGNLAAACREFALRHPQRSIVLIISDFLDKGGCEDALRYLIGRRYDLYVLQVLSPQEIEPHIAGDLRLVDVEDGDVAEVTVNRALLQRYRENLAAYCRKLRRFCTRRDATYLFTSTAVPFDRLVLHFLRRRGLLR